MRKSLSRAALTSVALALAAAAIHGAPGRRGTGDDDPVALASALSQQAYLKASAPGAGDMFGYAVAVSGDTAVVGVPGDDSAATQVNGADNGDASDAGAAYVFVRSAGAWALQARLKASNAGADDWFGQSVAISGDTIVVGAPYEDGNSPGVNAPDNEGASAAGAAYVFVRTGTTWVQQASLKASNPDADDNFGAAVAVSGDTVTIASPKEASSATTIDGNQTDNSAEAAGAAYVFVRSGATWSQQAYLKPSNGEAYDLFGWSLAASGDSIVVGAPYESGSASVVGGADDNDAVMSGAAYVFVRSGAAWSQQAYLKPSNTEAGDNFGWAVAIDGDTVVAGAPREASSATGVDGAAADNSAPNAGGAYVFVRAAAVWTQQAYLKASNTQGWGVGVAAIGDFFGTSVAVAGDVVVVGAPLEDGAATGIDGDQSDNSAVNAGAAYLFGRTSTTWTHRAYVKASNAAGWDGVGARFGDQFGTAVAADASSIVVGAPYEDSGSAVVGAGQADNSAEDAGAAYALVTADLPASPTIAAIAPGHASLSVSFTPPLTNGGAAITAYEYSLDGGTTWHPTASPGVSSPIVIVALINGTTYSVTLRAVNAAGAGAGSAPVNATPRTTPGAPTIVAISPAIGALHVAFAPPASDGGAPILTYESSLDGGTTWVPRIPTSTASPLVVDGLPCCATLTARVRAVNAAGPGPASAPMSSPGPVLLHTQYLAEGATSSFFDTRLSLLNPGATATTATLTFQVKTSAGCPDGCTRTHDVAVGAHTRVTLDPKAIPALAAEFVDAEFSTMVASPHRLVADRTMSWDADGYGAHAEAAVPAPSLTWYLAEGSTVGGLNLFYLVQNPNATEAQVRVRFLRPSGAPLEKTYVLPAHSRNNIWVNHEDIPGHGVALGATDVSAVFEGLNGQPFIVERALYLDGPGTVFAAGHESAGVTAPATQWFMAEGATGAFFDLFVLVANPGDTDAQIDASYLLPDGTVIVMPYTVAARSRFNIWVNHEDPRLADTAVSTTIHSTNGVPVIAERALWWPASSWYEAHASSGATATSTAWALADGEVGGTRGVETYILVANTSPTPGDVEVTLYFEDGTSAARTFTVGAHARFNVDVRTEFPVAVDTRFGAVVESLGPAPAALVVERAMYWDARGQVWAAGTNVVATPLR